MQPPGGFRQVRTIVWIGIAGALGALARYGLGAAVNQRFPNFPWGTLVINVTGSFALGLVFVVLTERTTASPEMRSALTIGFLGAYTTFSTFSLETVRLIEDGAMVAAAINVVGNVALGLTAAWAGVALGRAI
jgi:fluoride exporter